MAGRDHGRLKTRHARRRYPVVDLVTQLVNFRQVSGLGRAATSALLQPAQR